MGGDAELVEQGFVRLVGGAAVLADGPQQPLGEHAFQGGGDEEWLGAHVNEAGDGTGRVVGVQGGKHEVSGQGRLDGNLGGLKVADLTDEDAVRVLAQEGAEDAGKGQADGVVDGHLDDAVDIVFHGVFRGEQLGVDGVDFFECGVECGGFSGTGGAGADENAVGLADGLVDVFKDVLRHAEHVEAEVDIAPVKDTQHDALAVLGGEGGDTHVHLFVADVFDDATVLRDTFLRDVHVGHHLDAREDRQGEVDGRGCHFVECAVNPVADFEVRLEWLEVDVRCAFVDRLVEHQVNVADDGGGVGLCLDVLGVGFARGDDSGSTMWSGAMARMISFPRAKRRSSTPCGLSGSTRQTVRPSLLTLTGRAP